MEVVDLVQEQRSSTKVSLNTVDSPNGGEKLWRDLQKQNQPVVQVQASADEEGGGSDASPSFMAVVRSDLTQICSVWQAGTEIEGTLSSPKKPAPRQCSRGAANTSRSFLGSPKIRRNPATPYKEEKGKKRRLRGRLKKQSTGGGDWNQGGTSHRNRNSAVAVN